MSLLRDSILLPGIVFCLVALQAPAVDRPRQPLPGHVPRVVPLLQPIGRPAGSQRLELRLGLALRNQEALTNLLARLYDPADPQFRHFLSPEQFDEMFGPTEQQYQDAIAFARTNGFAVTGLHANRLLLGVSASVADIERAFQVQILTYRHPTETRAFYAPGTEPSVAAQSAIRDISGLDNFTLPRPKYRKPVPLRPGSRPVPKSGSGPTGTFSGTDYRAAYVPGVALDGLGQTLGLLEFDGYYAGDIAAYESQAGLPNVPLQNVLLDGFSGVPTRGRNSGNGEVALDIDMAISMAPGLAQVVVFEAGPYGFANDVLNAMSTNASIKQLSCSWSFGSTPRATMDQLFQKLAAQGQSFFDASGDSGAENGGIGEPDDDPYLTSVGGTALATTGPGGAWAGETVWNTWDGQSSSGGISSTYPIPTWQQGISMSANHGSTTRRNIPDVAMVADNIFIVADNGKSEITGGTSAAAPLWAGFTALVNQQAAAQGLPSVGFLNPAIYALGKSASYASVFDDITTGNNTNSNPTQFPAVPGYDLCTGWGSPAGSGLLIALANPDGFIILPGRGFVANGPAGGPFDITGQSLALTNAGNNSLTWSLGGLPPWLNASSSGGTLAPASPEIFVTLSLSPAASQIAAGAYTADIWFTNLTSGFVQDRQVTLMAGQEMVQDGGFEAGDFAYWTLSGPNASDNCFVDDGSVTGLSPESGTYFAALGQTNAPGYLSQTVPTRAGQPYLLSFWLQSADLGSGTAPSQFLVNFNLQPVFEESNLGAFDWTNLQFVVRANSASTVLQFGFLDDPGYLALDGISLTPLSLPVLQALSTAEGSITLAWNASRGLSYQVQYVNDLRSANWLNLGEPVTATSSTASVVDNLGPDPARFYRVVLLP